MDKVVSLVGAKKEYLLGKTNIRALNGVSMDVARGEFVALVGPSGSGKSTLLNVCGLLDSLDDGEYKLNGENVSSLKGKKATRFRRKNIGFIFQNFNLFPVMTVRENIEYPLLLLGVSKKQRQKRVAQAIEQVGLSGYAQNLPDKLSGGERQRVAIARALVKEPSLVVADEPTASLDTETANQIIDLMQDLSDKNNATFIVATHDERMSSRCERVIHLVDGGVKHAVA